MTFLHTRLCGKNVSARRIHRQTDTDNEHIVPMNVATKAIPELSETDKARFWKFVDYDGPVILDDGSKCWDWTGSRKGKNAKYGNGYGQFYINGINVKAHRVSYQMHNGEIPLGMLVCHRCDRPKCVNHNHLFVGTVFDNNLDKELKNRGNHPAGKMNGASLHPERCVRGVDQHLAKLTDESALEIRNRYFFGESQGELAKHYGVAKNCIKSVVTGKTWNHVPMPVSVRNKNKKRSLWRK